MQEILAFVLAASLMVISPGPNGVLIAKTAAGAGRKAGFATIAGFFAAFYLHGILSIAGVSVILVQSAAAFTALKFAGAVYLIWIGLKSLRSAVWPNGHGMAALAALRVPKSTPRAFGEGFLTNALNPKVSLFYLAAFPQFLGQASDPALTGALLVTLHALVNLVWFGAMVLLIAGGSRALSAPPRWARRALAGVSGVFFVSFGVALSRLRAP